MTTFNHNISCSMSDELKKKQLEDRLIRQLLYYWQGEVWTFEWKRNNRYLSYLKVIDFS